MPEAIRVVPWPDPVLDVIGHDPRSWYAETFWLPTLGPTALLLLRHLADRFELDPAGVELPVADTAAAVLGSDVAGADLLSEVDVAPSADGGTLIVTASSEQPDFAAAAADGYADALTEVAAARGNEVYKRASERLEEKLAELDPATPEAEAAATEAARAVSGPIGADAGATSGARAGAKAGAKAGAAAGRRAAASP